MALYRLENHNFSLKISNYLKIFKIPHPDSDKPPFHHYIGKKVRNHNSYCTYNGNHITHHYCNYV